VTIEGYVSNQRRAELYAGASLLVLPSLDEGFGLPALEAMALGVPVVASSRGALPEVLGDCGILIDPANVRDLADALEAVTTDPDLAARLRDAGIARAGRFNWPASARALVGAYAHALRQGSGRRRAAPRGPRE
jgi:glycosyltransferase involved in cell wall biosynthesis